MTSLRPHRLRLFARLRFFAQCQFSADPAAKFFAGFPGLALARFALFHPSSWAPNNCNDRERIDRWKAHHGTGAFCRWRTLDGWTPLRRPRG